TDGAFPLGGLLFGEGPFIWGTTSAGGEYGQGAIFNLISNNWVGWYSSPLLWSFNGADGAQPSGSLIWSAAGPLYSGTVYGTAAGGSSGAGVVFAANAYANYTTTALTSSQNPSAYGQPLILTANVCCPGGDGYPNGGTVSFEHGTTVLGTGAMNNGYATYTTSTLKVGTTTVTAVYGGDWGWVGSTSKTVSQVIGKATTTTALASSLNPSNVGQSVTFTATVAPQFSGEA